MSDSADSTTTVDAIAHMRASAASGKLVAVIGTGVSLALTGGANRALSWNGLIENGFEYGTTKGTISVSQKLSWEAQLGSTDVDEVLGAAEFMSRKLGAPNGELYGRWLENVFKEVRPETNEMALAILALRAAAIPLCTLNYDPLLERVTGLPSITLKETSKVASWIRRETEGEGILHLHGYWDQPTTCILGIRDYETTVSDEVRNLFQRNLSSFNRLMFIGCGDTFADPNFSALIKWLRGTMKTAAPQHYALVSTNEEARRHADSSWHGFVDPVSYGPAHSDLPAFLLKHFSFKQAQEEHPVSATFRAGYMDTAIRCIDDHEPKPQIFGRCEELLKTIDAVLEGRTVLIAGGPGMGKTAIATTALYDSRVVSRFQRHRVFVSLEAATEPRAIAAKIAEALGLPSTGDDKTLLHLLETHAANTPVAVITDNVETVFDLDRKESERLLTLIGQIQDLSLVVTIRGVAPPLPNACIIDDLAKLTIGAARTAFLSIAGAPFDDDPDLHHLLDALDGHVLSIRLIAAQAIGLPRLHGLRESWDEAHAEILRISGETEGRLNSVRASLALSLNSRRMKAIPLSRRLISLLSYLPAGLAESDVHLLLGERGTVTKAKANEGIICLHQLRLIEKRPDGRLRMLTPLRECTKVDVRMLEADKARLIDRYLTIANKAGTIGEKGWESDREIVETEAENLDAICELAVSTNINDWRLKESLDGLLQYHHVSGRGDVGSAYLTMKLLSDRAPSALGQKCALGLGRVASARSDSKMAIEYFEKSLRLSRSMHDLTGQATSIFRLGDMARLNSDMPVARSRIEEAQRLYKQLGSRIGAMNCLFALGEIASTECEHEIARKYIEEALTMGSQDSLSRANGLLSLGVIARRIADLKSADSFLTEARSNFERLGVVVGQANCSWQLGDVARADSDIVTAVRHYEEALVLCQRVGYVMVEFQLLIRLGLLQPAGSNQRLTRIEQGFSLYLDAKISLDRALPGWQALRRAFTTSDEMEAQTHRTVARSSWTAIQRLDLVFDWLDAA